MSNDKFISKAKKRIEARQKYLTYQEAEVRYGLGETTLRKMARDCKALYKIGRAARIDMEVFDKYFETFLDESEFVY